MYTNRFPTGPLFDLGRPADPDRGDYRRFSGPSGCTEYLGRPGSRFAQIESGYFRFHASAAGNKTVQDLLNNNAGHTGYLYRLNLY